MFCRVMFLILPSDFCFRFIIIKPCFMFALLDCNNFFVSCERALNPALENKPVVVLSNNDGCVVSRSNEAKSLGVPMGAPVFKYRDLFNLHQVECFSAKFEYYNFKSQQVSAIARQYSPNYEIYSIDELFLDFHGFKYFDLEEYSQNIKQRILLETNIPVSIGIAPTKTLAKLANRIAKKYPEKLNGVYILDSPDKIEKALKWLDIEDVWGIGRRLGVKMRDYGVNKAFDLFQKPEIWIRKMMGINGVRMLNELKGIKQLELDTPAKKQSIATTRSFMDMISEKEILRERIETFSFSCAEKLRKQASCCKMITVFVRTNRFRKDLPEYRNGLSLVLPNPSSSSIVLAKAANVIFDAIYKEGFHYKKAGVIVSDFVLEDERLINLFEKDVEEKHLPIMKTMDFLNKKYGKDKIRLASQNGKPTYERKLLSAEYEEFLKHNTLPEANFRFH